MKHVPQFAFYAAAIVLLVGSFVTRSSGPSDRHRLALTFAMDSGHFDVRAELGGSLLALRL